MGGPIDRSAGTVGGGIQVKVAGKRGVPVTDASLADYAHFGYYVETDFNGGPAEGWNGYDRDRHRFDDSYISPRFYRLWLDAKLGLNLAQANAGQTTTTTFALNISDRPRPGSIDDFVDMVNSLDEIGPRGGGTGGGSDKLLPDDLIAYAWVVTRADGTPISSQIIQRPITPMWIAVVDLPGEGTYEIWLRAVFRDNRQGERRARFRLRDWFVVGLGDSAASGEGNPDLVGTLGPGGGSVCDSLTTVSISQDWEPNMSNDAVWIEREAHRSMRSGPALAALALRNNGGSTLSGDRTTTLDNITFASFARSGAEITDGLISAQQHPDDFIGVGQLEECRRTARGRRIDALMISIGGNDIGFSGVLTDLVRGDRPASVWHWAVLPGDDAGTRREVAERLDRLLGVGMPAGQPGELEVRYNTLRREIDALRDDPGVGEVYISGYPTAPFSSRTGDGRIVFDSCGIFSGTDMDIDAADADVLESRGRQLNDLIRRKADEFGWHFVEVADEFVGHGYCMSSTTTYWVRASESCRRQGDFRGTMHPNHRGHAVYAEALAEAIRRHTITARRGPRRNQEVVLVPDVATRG